MSEGHLKRSVSGDKPGIHSEKKKKKKVNPAGTISASTTTVVTKTLLDDARNGFKNGNFVCSPLSLEIVLGMLAAGAEGQTLKQLLEFLGHESIIQLLSESPTQILSNPGLDFSLANGVWVNKRLEPVRTSYQYVLASVYKTEAKYVDFEDKAKLDEAVEEINSWVHKETKGLIPTIVERSTFSQDDLMVFVNALYFKGAWSYPFTLGFTRNRDFYLINGEKVSVPFMTVYKRFYYGSFKGYKMIKFPYKCKDPSKKFSMYIFLPHEKDGLKNLMELFHSDDALFHGDFDLKKERFDELLIPKFRISCTFEPEDVIKQMGLTLPFENSNTELSGIVNMRGLYDNKLYVSKILQESVIEVDERGTEAAAVTMMHMTGGGGPPPPPPQRFVADHPFMFMIREDTSKAVLFVGAVLNPSSELSSALTLSS
ncbi:serpin-ZX [Artemisia annua]|uniref:Serpin-ZX n=1 Tax=Artemisia annua TaxID=35608 RepID=A0A2U1Q516_ARTAN|nr:serpin-ZX [Artemisia annua]